MSLPKLFTVICKNIADYVPNPLHILKFKYSTATILTIVLSCVLAYCVNISTYLVIGSTSPITFQVLGHFKVLIILCLGIVLFSEDQNRVRLVGMLLALVGIVSYTYAKQNVGRGWKIATAKIASPEKGKLSGRELEDDGLPLMASSDPKA